MENRVGIITRTKNRHVLLKRAMESVLNQSYPNWLQVIINDGGDSEPVDKLLSHYAERAEERIRVIHNPKSLGMEGASNIGINSILDEVKYLIIHDDDDSWSPEFLTIAVNDLEQSHAALPRIMGVISMANSVYEGMEGAIVTTKYIEPFLPWVNRGLVSIDSMLHQCQFAPIQFLYFSEAIKKIGLYRNDLPVLGDWEFNLRFMSQFDIKIIPQYLAFYHHRVDTDGIYSNSVYGARDKHDFYRQMLKNEWLREDISKGAAGLGDLANFRPNLQNIVHQLDHIVARLDRLEPPPPPPKLLDVGILGLLKDSGRPFHYIKRFFTFLTHTGLKATLERTKYWIYLKSRGTR